MSPAPDDNTLEVTVLGKGVGESVLVHLPGGRWWIVDSFLWEGVPAALWYFDQIGVAAHGAVDGILVSHFDSDHYRGVDTLVTTFPDARYLVSDGMDLDSMVEFYGQEPDTRDRAPAIAHALAVERHRSGEGPHPDTVRAGQQLVPGDGADLRVLAPIAAACAASRAAVVGWATSGDRAGTRDRLGRNNRASVVLSVTAGDGSALLTGDLEDAPTDFGWPAVPDEPLNAGVAPASLMKVPHHGSATALGTGPWALVGDDPDLVLAPNSGHGLPSGEAVATLLAHGRLWQAARTNMPDGATDEFANRVGTPGTIGAVTGRWDPDGGRWRMSVLGDGFQRPPA